MTLLVLHKLQWKWQMLWAGNLQWAQKVGWDNPKPLQIQLHIKLSFPQPQARGANTMLIYDIDTHTTNTSTGTATATLLFVCLFVAEQSSEQNDPAVANPKQRSTLHWQILCPYNREAKLAEDSKEKEEKVVSDPRESLMATIFSLSQHSLVKGYKRIL